MESGGNERPKERPSDWGLDRVHNEKEAERIIGILGWKLGLADAPDELRLLKTSNSRKLACRKW